MLGAHPAWGLGLGFGVRGSGLGFWVSSLGVGVWSLGFGVDLFIGHGDLAEDRPQREGHV